VVLERPANPAEVFRALGDPVRWSIFQQIAEVDELARAELERTLEVAKPTVSYHTKALQQAGLISVRKDARNYYYRVQDAAVADVIGQLNRLIGRSASAEGRSSSSRSRRRLVRNDGRGDTQPRSVGATRRSGDGDVVLTW
jgi:DNA-binding transcriptional ArsR family regulator